MDLEDEEEKSAPPARKKTALDLLLGPEDGQGEASGERGIAVQEVTQYFAEKLVLRDTKPLEWWKLNAHHFPRLAKLAQVKEKFTEA